jgi:hypothetical protein
VLSSPTPNNPYHSTLYGIGPETAERSFTPTIQSKSWGEVALKEIIISIHGDNMSQAPFLSDNDVEDIKKRCEQATPGPWKSYVEGREQMSGSDFIMTDGEDIYLTGATVADQDFIAHARQDILKLLAEVDRLKKLLSK